MICAACGDDLRMDYTAQGHTVGLAQRMEQLAAAHAICLSEATAKAVARYVALHDLGPAKIKGAIEPVRVFELEGVSTLRTLAQAEFVYEQALYPVAEYTFKHPLTQEVAYETLLRERRARVHAAVAQATAEIYAEKLDEKAALLAHHCEQAGEPWQAALWHKRAAEWAGVTNSAVAMRPRSFAPSRRWSVPRR